MFHFHFDDGITTHMNHKGVDFLDLNAARTEALEIVAGILRGRQRTSSLGRQAFAAMGYRPARWSRGCCSRHIVATGAMQRLRHEPPTKPIAVVGHITRRQVLPNDRTPRLTGGVDVRAAP
jgi:hypothetical protein